MNEAQVGTIGMQISWRSWECYAPRDAPPYTEHRCIAEGNSPRCASCCGFLSKPHSIRSSGRNHHKSRPSCFSAATTVESIRAVGQLFDASIVGRLSGMGNCYQFELLVSNVNNVHMAIDILVVRPEVLYAGPEFVRELLRQRHVTTPLLPTCGTVSYNLLKLDAAHDLSRGAGVLVAVVDTGVDQANVTLNPPVVPPARPRVIRGPNMTPDPNPHDINGHGTHVAGIVAATAPASRIYAVKVCEPSLPKACTSVMISEGIRDAVNAGASIVNLSLGGGKADPVEIAAINYALNRQRCRSRCRRK